MKTEERKKERESLIIGEYRNGEMYYYPSDSLIISCHKVEEKKIYKILPFLACLLAGILYFGMMLACYYGIF